MSGTREGGEKKGEQRKQRALEDWKKEKERRRKNRD